MRNAARTWAAFITTPVSLSFSSVYPSIAFHSDLSHNSWLIRAHRGNGHCYAAHFGASKLNLLTSIGCRRTGVCPPSPSPRHQLRHRQRGQEGQRGQEDRRAHRLYAALRARPCCRWTISRCARDRERKWRRCIGIGVCVGTGDYVNGSTLRLWIHRTARCLRTCSSVAY